MIDRVRRGHTHEVTSPSRPPRAELLGLAFLLPACGPETEDVSLRLVGDWYHVAAQSPGLGEESVVHTLRVDPDGKVTEQRGHCIDLTISVHPGSSGGGSLLIEEQGAELVPNRNACLLEHHDLATGEVRIFIRGETCIEAHPVLGCTLVACGRPHECHR